MLCCMNTSIALKYLVEIKEKKINIYNTWAVK